MNIYGHAALSILSSWLLFCVAGCASPPNPHWNDKATINERKASSAVGGFNNSEKGLYHRGLQHMINAHQKAGSVTIRQLIDQEQVRANFRDDARKYIAGRKTEEQDRARQQREHQRLAAANRNVLTPSKVCANLHTLLADVGNVVAGVTCREVQSDLWNIHYTIRDAAWTVYSYDQRLQLAKGLWAGCIKAARMSNKPDGCNITLDGEAGERLGGSSWLAGSMIDVDKN